MSQAPIPNDPLRPSGVPPTGQPGASSKSTEASRESSAAFRALLDSLAEKAASLDEAGQSLGAPEELASAVDDARKSLEDAMSLGDRLLEAYRANQLADPSKSDEEAA